MLPADIPGHKVHVNTTMLPADIPGNKVHVNTITCMLHIHIIFILEAGGRRFTINFSLVVIYPSMVEFTINGVWAVVAIFRLY